MSGKLMSTILYEKSRSEFLKSGQSLFHSSLFSLYSCQGIRLNPVKGDKCSLVSRETLKTMKKNFKGTGKHEVNGRQVKNKCNNTYY